MRTTSLVAGPFAVVVTFTALVVACGTDALDPDPFSDALDGSSPADGSVRDNIDARTLDGAVAALDGSSSQTDASSVAPDAGRPDASTVGVVCLGAAPGAYCGNDQMRGADARVLYQCPGAGRPPTSSMACADGCVVVAGMADHCAPPVVAPTTLRLPWKAGTTMQLTQDCNDACCADHIGNDRYAWDFANGTAFQVVAARGGTVTHAKINSTKGCGTSTCADDANFIVVDHGDGTQATYLHLQGGSLGAGVVCGGTVTRGQVLATAGTTGWSTGVHLHFQVSGVHVGAKTCECGAAGTGCAANTVPWANFWVNATYPSTTTRFDEWTTASQCANRRMTMPASQN